MTKNKPTQAPPAWHPRWADLARRGARAGRASSAGACRPRRALGAYGHAPSTRQSINGSRSKLFTCPLSLMSALPRSQLGSAAVQARAGSACSRRWVPHAGSCLGRPSGGAQRRRTRRASGWVRSFRASRRGLPFGSRLRASRGDDGAGWHAGGSARLSADTGSDSARRLALGRLTRRCLRSKAAASGG